MTAKGSLLFEGGVIPVPNRLVDEVLPTLKDTELRVLLIVLRQTLGWREGSDTRARWRYKRRDWISHSQMVRRTGRGVKRYRRPWMRWYSAARSLSKTRPASH